MAENATVRLFDNQGTADRRAIVLVGTRPGAGGDVTLQSVVVTRPSATPETYSVVGTGPVPPVVPAAYLDETNGAGDLRLRRGSAPGTVAAALTFSAATPTAPVIFFGKAFDAAGGVDLRLVLGLPGPPVAGAEPPVASLSCRGSVEAIAGGTIFSAVPLEFQVLFDDLPSVFPSQGTPGLALGLPSEIPWPSLRLPWPTFPNLPTLPLRLPAFSISLAPLPIRAGWKAIEVGIATDGVATVHVEQFVLEGIGSKVGGSFDLVFSVAGGVDVQNPVFDGLNNLPNLSYKGLGPGCFGFDWKNCPATPLLRLVSTELNDPTSAAGNSFHLRINAPGGRLREVRLDWDAGAAVREIDLPGFGVSLPAPRMVSLIALRPDEVGVHSESTRVTLAATFEAGAKVQAFSTFSWPVGDTDREKFRDGTGKPSDKLITVTATAKNPVSLVLVDLPLEPGGSPPRFVQQLATPLGTFGDQEASGGVDDGGDLVRALFDSSPATPMNLIGLSAKDWSLSLDIDPTFADGITLPFLNQGGSQFLKLKVKKTQSDPNTLALSCAVEVNLSIGDALTFSSQVRLGFNLERMAFEVDHDQGLWLTMDKAQTGSFLGLTWSITPSPNEQVIPGSVGPGNLGGTKVKNAAFVLVTKNRNYELRQAPGSVIEIRYDRATTPDEPIIFRVSEFALTPRGVDLKAEVTDTPARFNGLETQFRFTSGTLQLHESRLAGFTIAGSGPLPPALVGDAVADVALQFAQAPDGGTVRLVRGSAHIKGSNLLRCQASRFEFALDGLGLEFVEDGGADHLYFTLSGRARYAPLPGDDSSGPLAWLPKIEIQLVDCPLTGNMRVIAQHIKFLVELPKKQTFDLLGCFQMELRGIGFVPQFDKLSPGDPTSAMQLSGQIMFAEGGGDVLETKVDFHDLFVALPARGSFVPRVYCKGIGIHIKQGETFELSGEVDFFNGEQVDKNPDGTPIIGDGFAGQGSLQIQGLPRLSATFAFLRVSPDGALTWKRAWFLYVEAGELSLMIPVIQIYIREIGLGFGYRYTLASIRTTDEINDPRKLLKELQRLSKTQGNLSSRDSWRIDLEGPGDSARWTVALRAMISQTSSQAGPFGDYVAEAESLIACLFLIDVVVALRSDLTFFMAGRAWVNTNYNDFLLNKGIADDDGNLRNRPLFSAFVLLSPRQKRFLANLSSNHDAAFGGHPPLPGFIKGAIRSSKFTATLLVEPDLFHLELGWPNQLQWNGDLGPLQVQFQGGAIFRVSETELVVGNSFLARGSLDIKAGFDAGFIGASLKAFASVAYGARYIGVLAFHDPFNNSAFYGAIGIEIHVSVSIEFWIKLELLFTTVKLGFSFSFAIGFTAALEVGIMIDPLNLLADVPAMRGTATISLEIMGHSVEFDVRLAFQGDKLNRAIAITEKFLNVGLEAEDVQPVPGTTGAGAPRVASTRMLTSLSIARGVRSAPLLAAPAPATGTDSAAFAAAIAEGPKPPSAYSLVAIDATGFVGSGADAGKKRRYVLLFPAASGSGKPPRFFPVPPSDVVLPAVTGDLEWTFPAPGASVHFEHFDPASGDFRDVPAGAPLGWKVDWAYDRFLLEGLDSTTGASKPPPKLSLQKILTHAYLTKTNGAVIPVGDPPPLASFDQSLEDDRVHNPTEAAYEAAVRGAFAQVASPYFKFDEQSPYDQGLKSAFNKDTTVYHSSGSLVGLSAAATREVDEIKRSVQLRGTVLHKMFRDVQRFAILEGHTDAASIREAADLRRDSLAFRFGVVFRATGVESEVRWLESGAGTLRQRSAVDSKAVDSAAIPVGQFNNQDDGFVARPPAFRKVRKYEHANMVAIAWELHREGGAGLDDDLEHHLSHYRVHRLHLDGNDPEAEFTVKKGTVLHRDSTGPIGILPRFQMVDRFDTETGADVAALTDEGKTYLYTITPVDLAGNQSPRPLSVVSTRLPSDPPLVPTDGELVVEYALADDPATFPATLPTMPRIRDADVKVTFQWSDPPAPAGAVVPPVDRYRLVFRREAALPVGFFGADHDTRGGRTAGFPVTNARSLRTDRVLEFGKNDPGRDRSDVFDPETGAHLRADTGRTVQQVTLTLGELGDLGVLPADRSWQPDSWRVFAQAVTRPRGVSGEGVPSALAAVAVRLRFVPKIPTVTTVTALPAPVSTAGTHLILPFEERKVGLLEWLPDPIRFNLLPPEDETSLAGFAQVPMPLLDEKKTAQWIYPLSTPLGASPPGLRFELHPERFRSLQMTWNQGPSGLPNYPIELHAKYQLFEFDADAQTGETLDVPPGVTTLDFGTWARDANLRLVQEVELLPAEDLPLVPSDTSHPLAWDVWSPARSRRIVLRRQMIEARTWPETTDRTKLGPWYSWRLVSEVARPGPSAPHRPRRAGLPATPTGVRSSDATPLAVPRPVPRGGPEPAR